MTYRFTKICVLLLCSVFAVATFAQNSNSTIRGTVQDASGAVVPGATVDLTNVGTGQTRSTTAKEDGFYTLTNLAPANYKLTVSAQGFAQWVGVLTLRVSEQAEVDAKLTAASVTTKVTVTDVTPVIDRVNPTISDVKNATAIATIPVANRSILNVLAFSPGVVAGNYGGSGAGNTRINGMPAGSVDYLVDGQTMASRNTNELQINPQPTPTFQEVKVITANGNAEYNRPGIVELVTKSGTNQFHGEIFELNQNNHLQARVFNQGASVPFLQHNEYGFQVGGPIWIPKVYNGRNKTFFFVDFEWIKQNANKAEQYYLPTNSERQGNLSDVFADTTGHAISIYDPLTTGSGVNGPYTRTLFGGNIIPANRLNPVTQKVLGIVAVPGLVPVPEPNIPGANVWNGQANYIPTAAKATQDNKLYTAKVDQLFGANRLAGRYTFTDNKVLNPEYYAPTEPDQAEYGGHNGSLTFTQVIGPRIVNVPHIGIQYNNKVHSGPIPIYGVSGLLGLPTYQTPAYWPQFYFDSSTGTDDYWTGIDRDNPKDYPDQTITATDQLSYNKGNHQFKFGFDYNNYRITTTEIGQPGGDNNNSGYYTAQQDQTGGDAQFLANTGSGLADFLLGDMDALNVNFYPVFHTRQSEYDGYAQDDWRIKPNLTLNLGVRYEYWTAFADASGMTSTFDPNIAGGMVVYQGSGDVPSGVTPAVYQAWKTAGMPIESAAAANYPLSLFNMPKNTWEPRVGFAYQLDSKTVLRGGYGIFHFAIPLISFQQAVRGNAPWSYSARYAPDNVTGGNRTAAELEFPIAQAKYGGPQPINQFQLGNQGCPTSGTPSFPPGTCTAPGYVIDPANAAASISTLSSFTARFLDPDYKPSEVQEYNLTLSRELPAHIGFQLSYIGNHSNNLLMIDPINMPIPRDNCAADGSSNVPACQAGTALYRRLYPLFGGPLTEYKYDGYANTNELQAQLTHTFGSGLTLQTYFTWMKALTTSEFGLSNGTAPGGATSSEGANSSAEMIPAALTPGYNLNTIGSGAPYSQRIRAVYANDPTLPAKTYQLNGHYQFPFGKGQRYFGNAHGFTNALVSGYNLSAFFLWHSGFYFSPYFSQLNSGSVGPGSASINLSPGKTGILPENQRKTARWFDPSIWNSTGGTPYAGQTYTTGTQLQGDFRNNIPLNYMTGPGFNNLDANVYKLTPIWRNLVLDFEAQFFNIYNHQNLAVPLKTGNITKLAGGAGVNGAYPRTIQLQAKIIF